jgi:hypothetical protein
MDEVGEIIEVEEVVFMSLDDRRCVCGHAQADHAEDEQGLYCVLCECDGFRQEVH